VLICLSLPSRVSRVNIYFAAYQLIGQRRVGYRARTVVSTHASFELGQHDRRT
jgi:hypothetical protein